MTATMTATAAEVLSGCTLVSRDFRAEDLAEVAAADRAVLEPRGSRTRSCGKKKIYGQRSALRAARRLRENQGEDVHAYKCLHCGNHHVGHRPVAWAS
jgi:hypothetical protein